MSNNSEASKCHCRICFSEENTPEDPLFQPCKCRGSIRQVHLKCLQQWINQKKLTKATVSVNSYFWKSLECELCKQQFPTKINLSGKKVQLRVLDYDLPDAETEYMVIESVGTQTSKSIHVIKLD